MLAKKVPVALAVSRWEVIKQLGNCTKEGEGKINKQIADDLPPDIDRKAAMKEMDNMARQSDMLTKMLETDNFGKKVVRYKLTAYGWLIYQNINDIERRPVREQARTPRGPNKIKKSDIPLQESLIFKPSTGVDAIMSAVDELVKENASLRAGLISTMKIKLDSLNKLRDLLGYGPLVESTETVEENDQ